MSLDIGFLNLAEEFLVHYFLPPHSLSRAKIFLMGHATELYLKAAYIRIYNDQEKAIKLGHEIKKLWDECKKGDPKFMPKYDIRDSIMKADILKPEVRNRLSEDDLKHYNENSDLYHVCILKGDTKYMGTVLKNVQGNYGFMTLNPNYFWITFFQDFNKYLSYPGYVIKSVIEGNQVSDEVAEALGVIIY